ncbi:MAG: hypothetical protein IPP61_06780 [Cytophagaceae bacterium]|nr:hypothetical protein [Cytophagaceae bacterium]MBL0302048.1 hypothetical protein [Cytophagaceae bacterium]MBL0324870.1 hypothetical protein [Cytophagaceae bacterium]
MKHILTIFVVTLFISCTKNIDPISLSDGDPVRTGFVKISVLDKISGENLLDPSTKNHFDLSKILLEFSYYPGKKFSIYDSTVAKPSVLLENTTTKLKVNVTDFMPDNYCNVNITWPNGLTDKITFRFVHSKTSQEYLVNAILVNDVIFSQAIYGKGDEVESKDIKLFR